MAFEPSLFQLSSEGDWITDKSTGPSRRGYRSCGKSMDSQRRATPQRLSVEVQSTVLLFQKWKDQCCREGFPTAPSAILLPPLRENEFRKCIGGG